MNKVVPLVSVIVFLAIGLAMLPVVGLPYGHFDWVVYSQGYGALENLALNRPTYASTYRGGYPPSYAVDGNPDTTWQSFSNYREWFYVILDGPQWVNQVVINWGDGYATDYRISVLVGGYYGYWQPVYDVTSGDGELDFVNFPAIYGDAVSISMFGHTHNVPYFSIGEFEAYYLPLETEESVNLAAGKPAYATTYQPGYEPSRATDTDMSTSWRPDPLLEPDVSSIYVDLSETYEVAQVNLYWGNTYPDRYRLYAWVVVWSGWYGYWAWWPIYEGDSAGDQDTAMFPPISTRYVRLVAYGGTGQGVDLREFEVYGGSGAPLGGSVPPSASYLSPDVAREGLDGVLHDLVPPGWEKSPAWHQSPSKGSPPIPELLPLRSVPSVDR